jgi:hypothetical protein
MLGRLLKDRGQAVFQPAIDPLTKGSASKIWTPIQGQACEPIDNVKQR